MDTPMTPASGEEAKRLPLSDIPPLTTGAAAEPVPESVHEALDRTWRDPTGLMGILASLQNDALGKRVMGTAFSFFLLGGILALLMRLQLIVPENNLISPQSYNGFFTMHGSTMMFLFAVPMLEGFAILLLPFLLGNREMPFPRLGVFTFWIFLFGGLLFYASFLFDAVPDAGWFAYVPLSGQVYSPGLGMDFWLLALGVSEIGAIAYGIEIIIAILLMRAPGMTISRMPVFAWAMLVTAFSIIFAFTPLMVGSLLLEVDRAFGTQFFNPATGGSPLLWQHMFWIFGHPEVYIQLLPALGFVSTFAPVFARRRLVGYPYVVMALLAIGIISFGLWAHHMFTTGLPVTAQTFFSAASTMVAIPSGVQILALLATIWTGRPVIRTPFLFVIGFIVLFVLGGITGVMVASAPLDWQVHDSYFVVAHMHYVLIGGVTFPIFAAIYYWFPKITGRMMDERLGKWHFWLFFIGFNLTFFPQHFLGLQGMPRRVYTYPADMGWNFYNLLSSLGSLLLAAGILALLANLVRSYRSGDPASNNPWEADTLEWSTTSPPPSYGFAILPVVRSRHPLWDQRTLAGAPSGAERAEDQAESRESPGSYETGQREAERREVNADERDQRLVQALGRWPLNWRAALVTGTLDARPSEVFRVAGPSVWPFVAAVGLIIIFASEIWRAHLFTLIGAVILLAALVAWHWPRPVPGDPEEDEAFEQEHGVLVRRYGSRAIARAGMAMGILVYLVALASMLFSYFYIRLENPAWPPETVPRPEPLFPIISSILLVLGAVAMSWAHRNLMRGEIGRLKGGLAAALVLGLAGVAVQIYALTRLDYTWTFNAYASIFYLLSGFMIAIGLLAILMTALVFFWALRGYYSPTRFVGVEVTALFWVALIAGWLIAFAVLYLAPVLT